MPDTNHTNPAEAAESIVNEGQNIRDRVRELVVRAVRERGIGIDELRDLAREVFEGATNGIKDALPDEQQSVLRRVVDGLSDGLAVAANATKLAFEEARDRGQAFAEDDIQQTIDDLKSLEECFVESVAGAAGKAKSGARQQAGELATHARRAFGAARPAIEQALRAAAKHPVTLAGEAGRTGAGVTRKAAGSLLQAMGGLLDAAGQLLAESGDAVKGDDSEETSS